MRACRQPAQHSAMFCFHQSLISRLRRQLPPREAEETPVSADWRKRRTHCRCDHRSPAPTAAKRVVEAPTPTDWRKICTHRNAPSVARRVLAFPFGEGAELASADEGMQAAGTAQCDALLCAIPHQSPPAPASPPGKPKRRRSLPIGANGVHTVGRGLAPAVSCRYTQKRLFNPAVEQPLFCFCLLDIALIDFRNHAGDLADHVMDHQCVFVG